MPSTLTGLLLFVVLLLPGFAYVVWKERAGTERRASTFRETVAVVAASITAELVTITVSAPLWTRFVSLGRLLREPGAYWHERPELLVGWGLSLLAVSSGFAVLATLPRLRQRLKYVSGGSASFVDIFVVDALRATGPGGRQGSRVRPR